MALFAYNITPGPVVLAAGNPPPTIPASPSPPQRGAGVNVTAELLQLTAADYEALDQQRPGTIEYEWTTDPEFDLGTLSGVLSATFGPNPQPHAADHTTGASDELEVVDKVATNQMATATTQTTVATNQTTVATNQMATTGLTVDNATATNQTTVATNQTAAQVRHETFIDPEGPGIPHGVINENAASASPSQQPSHPVNFIVIFDVGWQGGDVRIAGLGVDGLAVQETFPSTPGGNVVGVIAFATIDSPNGITNTIQTPGGDNATIENGNLLGVAMTAAEDDPTFFKLTVDGTPDTFAATDPQNRTFQATTLKSGARDFEVWYTTGVTVVQDTHTHVQDVHNHAVTDAGHNHTQDAHSHTQDAHGHTQDPHSHTQDAHNHDLGTP